MGSYLQIRCPFAFRAPLLLLLLHISTKRWCLAAPVLAPDIRSCYHMEPDDAPYNCCAPASHKPAIEFQFPSFSTIKIRRPAHLATPDYAHKLSRAYELMRALPMDDPRSFGHQANIHCAYCNDFYAQGNSTVPLQIHGSWLFFAFHRWYVYFHERILGRLLGDDTFALPFWNYDNTNGSTMPSLYVDYPELSDRKRQPSHLPPAITAIDTTSWGFVDRSSEDQLNVNGAAFYWVMVKGADTQYRFFGQPYRAGDYQLPGFGTVETMPHNSVHLWTGDMNASLQDMGIFATSAKDPLFYAHHASLDRLWEVWKTLSEDNVDIDDPDYLDSEFVFYDENADLVKVKVRDSLNTTRLGYVYEEVENLWLSNSPVAISSGAAQLEDDTLLCKLGEALEQPCSVLVARDNCKLSANLYNSKAETLVIQGVQVDMAPMHFNVFVNLPSANTSTLLNCTEFAGAFSTLVANCSASATVRLGIGFIVKELALTKEDSVVVTIVPPPEPAPAVKISSIAVVYEDERELSYVL